MDQKIIIATTVLIQTNHLVMQTVVIIPMSQENFQGKEAELQDLQEVDPLHEFLIGLQHPHQMKVSL